MHLDPDKNKIQLQQHKILDLDTFYEHKMCLGPQIGSVSIWGGDILNRVNRDDSEIQFAINILCPICNQVGHFDLMVSHEQLLLSNSC